MSVLIKGAHLLTMDPVLGEVESGDLLIEGDSIAQVGRQLDASGVTEIEADGMVALPGFVNTHHHLWQSLLKGCAPDAALADWLQSCVFQQGPCYEPEDSYHAARLGIVEALDGGVTTLLDFATNTNSRAHAHATLQAFKETGIRGIYAYGYSTTGNTKEIDYQGVQDAKEQLENDDRLLQLWLAVAGPEFAPEDQFLREWEFARAEGLKVTIHLLETRHNIAKAPMDRLKRLGTFGPRLLLAHAIHLSEAEIRWLGQTDTKVAHNPLSNMRLASGIAPVTDMLTADCNVGLGTDGAASNEEQSMFANMRAALGLQRAVSHDPRSIPTRKALELATIDGAWALGLASQTGSLTPGKKADLMLLDTRALNLVGFQDPMAQAVLGATPQNVDTVIVNGNIVKRHKALTAFDDQRVVDRAKRSATNLHKRSIQREAYG